MTDPEFSQVSAGEWDAFAPYTTLHLVTVCVCLLAVAGLVIAARRLTAARKTALGTALGAAGIVFWVGYNAWWNRHGLNPASGLPLHICDINGLIAPLALLTQNRWLRATAYFWTFALTTQAFIQPTLVFGPATAVFWLFWMQHAIILACAVYDLAVRGFRPDWRDLGRVYAVSAIYLAVVMPLNMLLGSNYGFVGDPPRAEVPPFVAALGPWPRRVVLIAALAALGFALLVLPWRRPKRPARWLGREAP